MVAVALLSAFIAMRLAIHGREVDVPSLAGLSMPEATKIASHEGLVLNLENRFYATDTPAGRVIAQDPPPGSRVRRDWQVRITESLGPQRVSVPDLAGQTERAATVAIRRLALDLGVVAHLDLPGDPDIVVTQTPPANSGSATGPRVSLLVSDPQSAERPAYVMPSLVGLSWNSASARASTMGLHLVLAAEPAPSPADPTASAASPRAMAAPGDANPVVPAAPAAPFHPTGPIAAQTPAPGRRVQRGDAVRVTIAASASLLPSQ